MCEGWRFSTPGRREERRGASFTSNPAGEASGVNLLLRVIAVVVMLWNWRS